MLSKVKPHKWLKSSAHVRILAIIILVAAILVTFAPLFDAGWVYDDVNLVKPSPALENFDGLRRSIATDLYSQAGARLETSAYWRPVAMFTFWLDTRLGDAPQALHVGNVLLHLLAALLLAVVIMQRLGGTTGMIVSLLAAAWWALHPQNVEVVAWISCRYEILTVIALLGLLATPWRPGPLHAVIIGLVFLTGLLSKESFGAMLVVVLAMDFAARRSVRAAAPRWVAIFIAIGVWMGLRKLIDLKGLDSPPFNAVIAIGFNYLEGIALYSWRAVGLPALTISHPLSSNNLVAVVAGGIIFLLLLISALFGRAQITAAAYNDNKRRLAVPVAIFLVGLVPMAGAITMFSEAPERYFYLPSIGLSLLLAELLFFALTRPQKSIQIAAASIFAVFFFAGLAFVVQRLPDWNNDEALWRAALRVNPEDAQANYNIGLAAGRRGKLSEARKALEIAVKGKPDSARIANAYAWVLLESRNYRAAVQEAKRATMLAPFQPNAWYYLAFASHKIGDHKGELAAVEKLLEVAPNYPRAREMREVAACEASGRRGCLRGH